MEVLVLEDEAFIAMDIGMTIDARENCDAVVCGSVGEAWNYLNDNQPSAAFLDVNLGIGETSEKIATELVDRGCPVTLLTGYSAATLPYSSNLSHLPRLAKPFTDYVLVKALDRMLNRQETQPHPVLDTEG